MTGAVLAGGKSSRMGGRPKALLDFHGRPLISWTVELLSGLADPILVSTNSPELYAFLGRTMVPDEPAAAGCGPLGGIAAVVRAAPAEHCLVVACDMPHLEPALLAHLVRTAERTGADVVVPVVSGEPEPLCAVYGKRCLEPIARRVAARQLKIAGFFEDVRVEAVGEEEVRRFDPDLRCFGNANTPEEAEALGLIK